MSKWEADYARTTEGKVTYRTVGHGLDIGPVASVATDFAVSDAPVTPDQFSEVGTVAMIPWALSGVAVVYHLDGGPKGLKLNSGILVEILRGHITSWDDPAIAVLNPGASLPDTPITLVYRNDESGEGYIYTDYLAETDENFLSDFGVSRQIDFPAGIRVKGETRIQTKIARTDGAIGFLDLPYAISSGLDIARIENSAGKFLKPNVKSLEAGGELGIRIGPNTEIWIGKLPSTAKDAYPLVIFSYAVVRFATEKATEVKRFLNYAISPAAQAFAPALHFAPLPKNVVAADRKVIAAITESY